MRHVERPGCTAARPAGGVHERPRRPPPRAGDGAARPSVRRADIQRAHDIFAAFRANLRDSLARLRTKEAEAEAMLWPDDQQKQRRRDIEAMQRRLDELDDEEAREIAAITERYAEVKPHTTAAAVVFALTPEDAKGGLTLMARQAAPPS